MKRLLFAVVMALLFFALLNFIYCNLDDAAFGAKVVFKFSIPYAFALQSQPLPLGFILLASFVAGMVAIALLEALPSFFKTMEIRAKNKKIRQLERELTAMRQFADREAEKVAALAEGAGQEQPANTREE